MLANYKEVENGIDEMDEGDDADCEEEETDGEGQSTKQRGGNRGLTIQQLMAEKILLPGEGVLSLDYMVI